jgi:hypothetical protein
MWAFELQDPEWYQNYKSDPDPYEKKHGLSPQQYCNDSVYLMDGTVYVMDDL